MPTPLKATGKRKGIAMMLVLGVGLVVLAIGMAMITTSGDLLQGTVDAKQRIRARYAAEGMIAIQIARTVEKASVYFGKGLSSESIDWMSLGTGSADQAKAEIISERGDSLPQEKIQSGRLKGLTGLKIPIRVTATSKAGSRAKLGIDADVRLYQVPIFQFGVFYEGNLEVSPGGMMTVLGPVHTNSNAYFRGFGSSANLRFEGPVTVSGTLYHWNRLGGKIIYHKKPDTTAAALELDGSKLGSTIVPINALTRPEAIDGIYNVEDKREKLILPIGGATPHQLIELRDNADDASLKLQKFDRMVSETGSNRWVNGITASRPSWITGPKVFFDRRERRWVKFWDFDVAELAKSTNKDSIFYLADTILMKQDHGTTRDTVINAFRIINAARLPRNMTIATVNPIYILGNFNLAQSVNPVCAPYDATGLVKETAPEKAYCNAMIAADAVTLLDSTTWMSRNFKAVNDSVTTNSSYTMRGTLERPDTLAANWTTWYDYPGSKFKPPAKWPISETTNLSKHADTIPNFRTVRVNAAILTGNKASRLSALAPANTDDTYYNNNYEGGWHNSIRFLESFNTSNTTVMFIGSFVCLWTANTRGLRLETTGTPTIGTGYYNPPIRIWGFDRRFATLKNMPPGTPFLATAIYTNWVEKQ